jgi:hypothetical protein
LNLELDENSALRKVDLSVLDPHRAKVAGTTMTTLGKYSKGLPLKRFREFTGWKENLQNARKIKKEVDGTTVEVPRQLHDSDYLYVHENFHVTDGIFFDENIIFNEVSPAWIDFCENALGIKFPDEESEENS